jgi:hypothetical protein
MTSYSRSWRLFYCIVQQLIISTAVDGATSCLLHSELALLVVAAAYLSQGVHALEVACVRCAAAPELHFVVVCNALMHTVPSGSLHSVWLALLQMRMHLIAGSVLQVTALL